MLSLNITPIFNLQFTLTTLCRDECFSMSRWGQSAFQGPEGVARSVGPPRTARAEGGRGSTGAERYSRPARGEGKTLQPFQPADVLLLPQMCDITSTRLRHRHQLQHVSDLKVLLWFKVVPWPLTSRYLNENGSVGTHKSPLYIHTHSMIFIFSLRQTWCFCILGSLNSVGFT